MTNHNGAFPGNPYARNGVHIDGGTLTEVARAIKLLAFEVRTANKLARMDQVGKSLEGMSEDAAQSWIGEAIEVGERLGIVE